MLYNLAKSRHVLLLKVTTHIQDFFTLFREKYFQTFFRPVLNSSRLYGLIYVLHLKIFHNEMQCKFTMTAVVTPLLVLKEQLTLKENIYTTNI